MIPRLPQFAHCSRFAVGERHFSHVRWLRNHEVISGNGFAHLFLVQQAEALHGAFRQFRPGNQTVLIQAVCFPRKREITPVMAEAVIIGFPVFPRPILHRQLAEGHALLRNVVAGVVALYGAGASIEHRSAADGNIQGIGNGNAVHIDPARDKNPDLRLPGAHTPRTPPLRPRSPARGRVRATRHADRAL